MVKLEYFKEAVRTAHEIYDNKRRLELENRWPGSFPGLKDRLEKTEVYFAYLKIDNEDGSSIKNINSQNIKFLGLYDVLSEADDYIDEESAVEDIISEYGFDLVSEVDDEDDPAGLLEYYVGDAFENFIFNHARIYFVTDRKNVYLMSFNENDNRLISIYEIFIDGNKLSKIGNL